MSRIGKQPIGLPADVTVTLDGQRIVVKGPKGELTYDAHPDIEVRVSEGQIICSVSRQSKKANALWGAVRARLNNMVTGVTHGFVKKLELHGVGYRASISGSDLELSVGFSHTVKIKAPDGIQFSVDKEVVTVSGNDNEQVGQAAADIRSVRKPEPYKGKGIRYQGEIVRRKVGKVVGVTE